MLPSRRPRRVAFISYNFDLPIGNLFRRPNYHSMNRDSDKSGNNSPERPPKGSRKRPPQGTGQIIEFVDSQDPNVKSAIQRHTAYHSAAQRREARLASLRRGSRTRYLEWGRRQGTESVPAASPPSSGSSVSLSPVSTSIDQPASEPSRFAPSDFQSLESTPSREALTPVLTQGEETIVQFFIDSVCPHADKQQYEAIIAFSRTDEACIQLLLAYCYAMRGKFQAEPELVERDHQTAQQYFGRGTNLLWNRLRNPGDASSDVNIQAVLLLVVFASDFGQPGEVDIHAGALRTMVSERGGIDAINDQMVLRQQLNALETSRCWHLTLNCESGCAKALRFPNGFWAGPQ